MAWMMANAGQALDERRNAGQSPECRLVAVSGQASLQRFDHLLGLWVPRHFRWEAAVGRSQNDGEIHSLVVRTRGDPTALAAAINREILALDRRVPAYNLRAPDDAVSGTIASKRFVTLLTTTFGAVALGLVVLCLAGVLTDSVVQCRRELGVRRWVPRTVNWSGWSSRKG